MATLYYRPQALETIARHILTQYDEMYLNGKPRAVPIETIIEKTFGLRIEYQYLTNDGRELGRMIYDNGITTYYDRESMDYALMRVEGGTMLIEASLLEDEACYGRLRFTLAHELAHYILHKRIFKIKSLTQSTTTIVSATTMRILCCLCSRNVVLVKRFPFMGTHKVCGVSSLSQEWLKAISSKLVLLQQRKLKTQSA